jgi:NAD(P)-dependent dehydrogenase (short-subunit alcohol dehydrogenase family)
MNMESVGGQFSMKARIALITGAGRGIGLAVARALADAGAAVAIQDIDFAVAENEAGAINENGGRAIAVGGDILDLSLPARLVSEVVQQLGGLHVLINNASIQDRKPWMEVTAEEMERIHRGNVVAPMLLIQQVTPIFRQQRYGRIINIGSIQQRSGNPGMLPYSLSKGTLEKITRGLARDLARDNITINLIAPGWVTNTHRNRDNFENEQQAIDAGKRAVPLGRLGDPTDYEGIALLLCSDAGEYITGQNIFVDGGMSA